ncbi:hypothetical protein B1U22_05845 (plasmid) [Borreliella burgdorferi]|uniref:Uncharacterized protein n=1 Tax=Borreliella burgdorferi (strain ATCC 35210 / DSM 4680 / CIP 102532 / B31) TaxID=224326 RepID=G5IXI4_BORBU|nr:hypothetical protein BBU64B_F0029 [Borreliella burgdorferi 64b]AET25134.1 hypothetical protein BB_F0039 [Borreliella burgdorferi B31]ARS32116.1 hypothetical protein B1U22_05845 [Borreliella burgdorferi]ARS32576.1 hypothetical protein B1U21_01600 [Borreliella burgdorferi]PNL81686.1 hypothetical protein A6J35_006610 [Borreliella burgdorferi]
MFAIFFIWFHFSDTMPKKHSFFALFSIIFCVYRAFKPNVWHLKNISILYSHN